MLRSSSRLGNMDETTTAPLSGRKAQAARNDQRILDSARAVFLADPEAPIAAVAEHAGVGISALYRRYRSKEELLQRLAGGGLRGYPAARGAAPGGEGGPRGAVPAVLRPRPGGGTRPPD